MIEQFIDEYTNLLETDIKNFKTVSGTTKDILILLSKGYYISDIAHITGLTVNAIQKRLKKIRENKEVQEYFK